ncbi:N-formylglutamate amidohydrolase [Marinihelvus fidelis]|uniref:N-formylglutamate amidohydrolase n=1 Tax=Marinihelvus fidelis TaxID=2613842 RepID=A0A5N0T6H9_9GAMM|nr:N-formylglutamate amidohydrolase [Marinihelvus fidelis]KAA9130472.1 N-formylglutamate amidohydrolase [Marinihelvus fidelis]
MLGPGDPAPFEILNPQGRAPFLLTCDHASRAFPGTLRQLGVADWVLERHVARDIGAAGLTRALSARFDATAVLAGYSRLVIDLNRHPDDPTAFVRVSDGIAIPGNLGLDQAQRQLRIEALFNPYHDAIEAQLDGKVAAGHTPPLVSIHTCAPVFNGVSRRWHIGVMWDRDPRLALPLLDALRDVDGLCVGDNEPYSGRHPADYTVDVHGEGRGLPCVGIEVRQDLVSSAEGLAHWAGILGDALERAFAEPAVQARRPE